MTHHISASIEGLLRLSNSKLSALFDRHGESIRKELKERLANGERLIPSDKCDNFDPIEGCKGHIKQD